MPRAVRDAVARKAGLVLSMNPVAEGRNSPLSLRLETTSGALFVKGVPDVPGRVATQRREYAIGTHLRGLGPAARWQVRIGGWHLVAFEHLDQVRHADYRPDSVDLPKVAELLVAVGQLPVPAGVELRRAEQRFGAYGTSEQLRHVVGGTLLHTDLNPGNVLIGDGAARLVDWGWATLGAPWLDAAAWAVWLVASGHAPESAHAWTRRVPAYRAAHPAARLAYARMSAAMWADIAQHSSAPWAARVSTAAGEWAEHCARSWP
ncbi:phosphotransferase family protein [Streptomyces xantholiticus]|uniref:Phosphotransferase n=1 Tax=Streptomyces xantholiticus TaxID=68285 RepID=A0ABV1V2T7_9ACTN